MWADKIIEKSELLSARKGGIKWKDNDHDARTTNAERVQVRRLGGLVVAQELQRPSPVLACPK